MKLIKSYNFQFQSQELPQKLSQVSQEQLTGYWLFEFPSLDRTDNRRHWYLGLSQGQVVFSGNQELGWQILLRILQRYVSRLQKADVKAAILALEQRYLQETQKEQSTLLIELLHELQQLNLFSIEELKAALRLRILSDFDAYLLNYSGEAQFLSSSQLDIQIPLSGFNIEELLSQAKERQSWWHKLRTMIPSMESVPVLNSDAVKSENLNLKQVLWLKTLTSNGKTLNEIASFLAQDSLEVAKIFASLISKNLVNLKLPSVTSIPEIFVVDDSPIILKQFERLVTKWGYSVRSFQEPKTVLEAMKTSNPVIFFLDINMPDITGFDLVKQIRRQSQFASVPIIMLTAEQTLANNWRARWSGCQFLSKPLTSNDVPKFQQELRVLLSELLTTQQSSQAENQLRYQT